MKCKPYPKMAREKACDWKYIIYFFASTVAMRWLLSMYFFFIYHLSGYDNSKLDRKIELQKKKIEHRYLVYEILQWKKDKMMNGMLIYQDTLWKTPSTYKYNTHVGLKQIWRWYFHNFLIIFQENDIILWFRKHCKSFPETDQKKYLKKSYWCVLIIIFLGTHIHTRYHYMK